MTIYTFDVIFKDTRTGETFGDMGMTYDLAGFCETSKARAIESTRFGVHDMVETGEYVHDPGIVAVWSVFKQTARVRYGDRTSKDTTDYEFDEFERVPIWSIAVGTPGELEASHLVVDERVDPNELNDFD